jgi:transposase
MYDEPRPGAPRKISHHTDVRKHASPASALEHARTGESHRIQPHDHQPYLARLRIATAPYRYIQTVAGFAADRKGTRPLRLVYEPARSRVGTLRRRRTRFRRLTGTQPLLPMQPGQLERGTHDYKCNGTTSLFAALDLKTSRVISQFHQRHRSVEFRKCLDVIEAQVPADLDVHLILDNYGIHKTAIIRNWLAKRRDSMSISRLPRGHG